MEAGKVPTIYIHDQYCRDIDQKNNAFKVVIDIGFRPLIEALVRVSILGKPKDTVNEDDSKKKKKILRLLKRTLHEEFRA